MGLAKIPSIPPWFTENGLPLPVFPPAILTTLFRQSRMRSMSSSNVQTSSTIMSSGLRDDADVAANTEKQYENLKRALSFVLESRQIALLANERSNQTWKVMPQVVFPSGWINIVEPVNCMWEYMVRTAPGMLTDQQLQTFDLLTKARIPMSSKMLRASDEKHHVKVDMALQVAQLRRSDDKRNRVCL